MIYARAPWRRGGEGDGLRKKVVGFVIKKIDLRTRATVLIVEHTRSVLHLCQCRGLGAQCRGVGCQDSEERERNRGGKEGERVGANWGRLLGHV